MESNQILIDLGIKLAQVTATSTVSFVSDKITKAKAISDKEKTIQELEGIIDELINDKRALIEIAKGYEEVTSF